MSTTSNSFNFETIRKNFDPLIKRMIYSLTKRYKKDHRIEEDDLRQEADLTILNVISKFKVEEYKTAEHAYASFINYIKTSLFRNLNRYCKRNTKSTQCANIDCGTELNNGFNNDFYIIKT